MSKYTEQMTLKNTKKFKGKKNRGKHVQIKAAYISRILNIISFKSGPVKHEF